MSPDLPIVTPRPKLDRGEMAKIAFNLTLASALAALVLGAVYMGTERYAAAEALNRERTAIVEMLGLGAGAEVTEVDQSIVTATSDIVYRARAYGEEAAPVRQVVFSLDGRPLKVETLPAASPALGAKGLRPLGRMFVARQGGALAGFVVEGVTQGYKNRVRFLIGLDSAFAICGVRVTEHEEDPGLGAEIANAWFEGQFLGRTPEELATLNVTRDPMPEDWRAALAGLARTPVPEWREQHGELMARESAKPIYAVTGATISSRALTDGVRATVDHFRRRWALLEPQLGAGA